MVKELNTEQYTWCRDDTDVWCSWNTRGQEAPQQKMKAFAFLSEKKTNTTIEEVDYSTVIEMNRRIPMQMITPVSMQHHNSHLENINEKQDENI